MSLLWPEIVHVGLFPGKSWMQRKRVADKEVVPPGADPDALLRALDVLLDADKTLKKGSRVDVTVSDSIAAVMALPWQDKLGRAEEVQGYARAVFERAGMAVDDDWVMRVEYRHFGAAGLAYALPKAWMAALLEVLGKRGLRLRSVLPVSAAAYSAGKAARANASTAIVLGDSKQCSALVFDKTGLVACDAEPAVGGAAKSMERLFKRLQVRHASIRHVFDWSPDNPAKVEAAVQATSSIPHVQRQVLARNAWSARP